MIVALHREREKTAQIKKEKLRWPIVKSLISRFFLCITKKEVKVTKIQKAWNIVSDGNRHPVERRRDPSPTHKLRKMEKTYKD